MTLVFLSHSSKDKPLAKNIAEKIMNAGIEVWFDEWQILVGDSITQKIQKGLESANYVAVLLTKHSAKSGWVEKEWQSKIGEEAKNRNVVILPIKADDCVIPILLRDKRYADCRTDFNLGINDLVLSIKTNSNKAEKERSLLADAYEPVNKEAAICIKAESQFRIELKDLNSASIWQQNQNKLDKIIYQTYAPICVLSEIVNMRIEMYVLPLIQKYMNLEIDLRRKHHVPFSEERISVLKHKFRDFGLQQISWIISIGCEDARTHIIYHVGQLQRYKDEELIQRTDALRKDNFEHFFKVIDVMLDNAYADLLLECS